MISILQGETLSFALSGDELATYEVHAALRPSIKSFRRDCSCGAAICKWDKIDIVDGVAVWTLTSEQSAVLSVGQYAMEVSLKDIATEATIKESTIDIIEVEQSYTR